MLASVKIKGTTPLMLDRFYEGMLVKGPKSTNRGDDITPQDQAIEKLYYDDKGTVGIPADNMLKCIIDAGVFIKIGKRQLSTRDSTIVTSFLSIVEPFIPIKTVGGWRVDSRGVVNQTSKVRVIAHRPIFDDWEINFTLDIDTREVQEKTARELLDRAGRAIGLGVMRPSRKGRYGQFKVECWEAKPQEKPKLTKVA